MSAHAAKPKDCQADDCLFGGGVISFKVIDAKTVRVDIDKIYVTLIHKDGTREPMLLLGGIHQNIKAPNAAAAEAIIKKSALQRGTEILKQKYCPIHGCNK